MENKLVLEDIIKQIKKNLDNCQDGDVSYQRCFNNILELTEVALDFCESKRNDVVGL